MPTKPSPALAILILLLLSALVSQLIAALSWGHASFQLTEWLINYSGGFVRRGLPGALIGSISETTRIQANYIAIFLGLVFYLVLATYLLLRATPTFPAILILSCIVIGFPAYQDSIVRKDCLGLLFLIGILSVDRSRLPRTTAILVINLLAGVAILSHETFVFYALAAFILFRHRDREEVTLADFTRRSLSLLPAAGCFLLTVIYHGTPEQAEAVNQSWLPLWRLTDPGNPGLETPSAAISALGWTSEKGLSLSLYLLTSGFYQPMAWAMVFIIAFGLVILFTDRNNLSSASARLNVKIKFTALLVGQWILISPLFLLGVDYGRWLFLWVASSIILYINDRRAPRWLESLVESIFIKAKLPQLFKRLPAKDWYLLFFGVPVCWNLHNFLFASPISRHLETIWRWF